MTNARFQFLDGVNLMTNSRLIKPFQKWITLIRYLYFKILRKMFLLILFCLSVVVVLVDFIMHIYCMVV